METFYLEFKSRIKLRKLLTRSNYCLTKREAVNLIRSGMVAVNGTCLTKPGAKVSFGDVVETGEKKISVE